jgi:hypothetical protein
MSNPNPFSDPRAVIQKLQWEYQREHPGVSDRAAFTRVTESGDGAVAFHQLRKDERDPAKLEWDKKVAEVRKLKDARDTQTERLAKQMAYEDAKQKRQAATDAVNAQIDALADDVIAAAYAKGQDVSRNQARNQVYLSPKGSKLYNELRRLETEDSLERSTAVSSGPARAIRS